MWGLQASEQRPDSFIVPKKALQGDQGAARVTWVPLSPTLAPKPLSPKTWADRPQRADAQETEPAELLGDGPGVFRELGDACPPARCGFVEKCSGPQEGAWGGCGHFKVSVGLGAPHDSQR